MHEAFDPEPIRELPADEPRTPMWLPAVGVALLLALGAYWLGTSDSAKDGANAAAAPSASAVVPAPAPAGAHP